MDDRDFFDAPEEASRIKSQIVKDYFLAWANVMINTLKKQPRSPQKIAYIDLFAGCGRYKDGSPSTPIFIVEEAIRDKSLRDMLIIIFNDKEKEHVALLSSEIKSISGIETLKYEPRILQDEVGDDLAKEFKGMKLVPTFSFIDPWGYKGLSLSLFRSITKDWGCDCVFYFNYNRINMVMSKDGGLEQGQALFGIDGCNDLARMLKSVGTPEDREHLIMDWLEKGLKEIGVKYVLTYRIKSRVADRPSHYLVFLTKDFLGYDIMKRIMDRRSSEAGEWKLNLGFDPTGQDLQYSLFGASVQMNKLGSELAQTFAGRKLSMKQIYKEHTVGTPYVKRHYKKVLSELEKSGDIVCDPPAESRQKRNGEPTFGDKTVVTFTARNESED
ncbi:MAG: three-Cys-motif partner protein TcmP [candidate division Zixibacteria bacterium]|nr:three-Cys-motif partner protein TcmP [candidate division Zixibacteria bacterium]MBU1471163.1 three-Cys-motif partner protein TcmP [candidate division Zixibacteria bacterium]MBU2625846.1 three-Cys-motif partner protein TcmP [candidate division Zixibacteria bacterium]